MPRHTTLTDAGFVPSARLLFWVSIAIYGATACAAIFAGRHAFGDAANFLVMIVTNGAVTQIYDSLLREFPTSRVAALHVTQGPAVALLDLGVTSLALVSLVYGATLWGLKLASLALCYWLLTPADKPLFVFPLLTLVAGSVNADLYIVSESHVMVSFFWPALIALTGPRAPTPGRCTLVLVLALLMLATYESALFFGPLIAFFAFRAAKRLDGRSQALCVASALLFLLGAALAAYAVAYPRDLTQRGDFVSALWNILITRPADLRRIPVGPTFSVIAMAVVGLAAIAQMRSRDPGRAIVAVVIALAAMAGMAMVLQILLADATLQVGLTAIWARVLNLIAPMAFAVAYITAIGMRNRRAPSADTPPLGTGHYRLLAGLAAVALVAQGAYQMILNARWVEATAAISAAIERGPGGPIAFQDVIAGLEPRKAARITALVGDWWIQPLSMLLARDGRVRTIVVFEPGNAEVYRPFDPMDPNGIPTMKKLGWNTSDYVARLHEARMVGPATTLDFRTGGNGWRFAKRGLSLAEPWGTWSAANEVELELPGPLPPGGLSFQVDLQPFLPRPDSRLRVTALVGADVVGEWVFTGATAARTVPLRIPARSVPAQAPLRITFRIDGAQSPASAGLSDDQRLLGIGLITMRLEGAP